MRGKPDGYDLPKPPIEVSTSHDVNASFFFIYAPPLYYSSQVGATPVYITAEKNHVAALDLLIKANADVNKAL
jgi:hypothetical protein